MTIIPVIDIQYGQVVRAVAGDRNNYKPLQSIWTKSTEPVEVARVLWENYCPEAIYIADLDAIAGRAPNRTVLEELQRRGILVWLDAGRTISLPAQRIVYGLESWKDLPPGAEGGIFSLDLKHSESLGNREHWPANPFEIAERAVGLGFQDLILLDLARVGTGNGVGTEELALRIKSIHLQTRVYLGGGIASSQDVERLAELGIDGVLVASALHDGRIKPISVR